MDVSLSAEADRHWTHVTNQKYQYYRGQIVASMINRTTKAEVVEWLRANLVPTEPSCRRVTVFVHGKNHPLVAPTGDEPVPMGQDDVDRLKLEWELHPNQGDPTTVPALEIPPEDVARLSNTDVEVIERSSRRRRIIGERGCSRGEKSVGPATGGPARDVRRRVCVSQTRRGRAVQDAATDEVERRRERGCGLD